MPTTAIVILHYESIIYTKQCLDSLLECPESSELRIIVVDNGSKKEPVEMLKKQYRNVDFIVSDSNLGFAKGNNLGFQYAKEKYSPEIIILSNSDIVFKQKNFFAVLFQQYESHKFDVAGPRIISLADGKNQNPVQLQYVDVKSVNRRIIKLWILLITSYFGLDKAIHKLFANEIKEFYPGENDVFQLHGAFLMFGKKFINQFNGLCDQTFMYNEESILAEQIKKHGMIMQYIDSLVVYHEEGGSTSVLYGKGKKKRQFYYYWNIDSCKVLRDIKKGKVELP